MSPSTSVQPPLPSSSKEYLYQCPKCKALNSFPMRLPDEEPLVCMSCEYVDSRKTPPDDPVKHPGHYTQAKIEVIDFINAWGMDFFQGNIVKYVTRYKLKGGVEDLKKAQQYLTWLINITEGKELEK